MKGDFSRVPHERTHNFAGVLHQQGRVLLDADWNAQTAITTRWEDTAGRDIIGAGVAAVPADQPDGFKIVTAAHAGGTTDVQLTVKPGRAWADGLLVQLFGEPDPDSVGAGRAHRDLPAAADPATGLRHVDDRRGCARRGRARSVARGVQRLPAPGPADRAGPRRTRHHRARQHGVCVPADEARRRRHVREHRAAG